jgi:hypothetical protein
MSLRLKVSEYGPQKCLFQRLKNTPGPFFAKSDRPIPGGIWAANGFHVTSPKIYFDRPLGPGPRAPRNRFFWVFHRPISGTQRIHSGRQRGRWNAPSYSGASALEFRGERPGVPPTSRWMPHHRPLRL